jgi:hypothetical protein
MVFFEGKEVYENFRIDGREVRYYFTDGEKNTFSRMDDFGVPISNLNKSLI